MQREDDLQIDRPSLFSLAYAMLGSSTEAEACVREAMLGCEARDHGDREVDCSSELVLSKALIRLCIDRLPSARVQNKRGGGQDPAECLVGDAETSALDITNLSNTLSVAFLHLLTLLPPLERQVFLLRRVFRYDVAAIAAMVLKSEEECHQIERRALEQLRMRRPTS